MALPPVETRAFDVFRVHLTNVSVIFDNALLDLMTEGWNLMMAR